MTQRQHMTYRSLCTVSENQNVLLLIIPFVNEMFHIIWHFMSVFSKATLTWIPGQIRQNKHTDLTILYGTQSKSEC